MTEEKLVRVRPLSGAEFREGLESGWTGKTMNIHFVEHTSAADWSPGTLVEVESAARLYLGILEGSGAGEISILVEHMLNLGEIQWIPDVWG